METDLPAAIAKACSRGVDVDIDHTGGAIHDAVMQNLATGARIVIVGSISLASKFGQPDVGLRFQRQILIARTTIKGFLVSDYQQQAEEHAQRFPEAAHQPEPRQATGASNRRTAGSVIALSVRARCAQLQSPQEPIEPIDAPKIGTLDAAYDRAKWQWFRNPDGRALLSHTELQKCFVNPQPDQDFHDQGC